MKGNALVGLIGTAGIVLGLSACGSAEQPDGRETGQAPATQKVRSPEQELGQIGSTLDAIDRELAGDDAP